MVFLVGRFYLKLLCLLLCYFSLLLRQLEHREVYGKSCLVHPLLCMCRLQPPLPCPMATWLPCLLCIPSWPADCTVGIANEARQGGGTNPDGSNVFLLLLLQQLGRKLDSTFRKFKREN